MKSRFGRGSGQDHCAFQRHGDLRRERILPTSLWKFGLLGKDFHYREMA